MAMSVIVFLYENQYFGNLTRAGEWEEAREFSKWFYPLLKLDTYIKLVVQEVELGADWGREPRLPLAGEEREPGLKMIHHGMTNRPKLG